MPLIGQAFLPKLSQCRARIEAMNASTGVDDLVMPGLSPIDGQGLFACLEISAGMAIVEYAGEKISKAESLARCQQGNHCIFALDADFDLDGNVPWNPARLINHHCTPNCEATLVEGRIWIMAKRDIQPREEITFNYGYDLNHYREHPCHCRDAACLGFIVAEEFFPLLRRRAQMAGASSS
jgi:SET domain-containing protein